METNSDLKIKRNIFEGLVEKQANSTLTDTKCRVDKRNPFK